MVKIPKIVPVKIIAQVQFKPELTFYELMYTAAARQKGYRDWETDRLSVTLRDTIHHASARINHNSVVYEQDGHNDDVEMDHLANLFPDVLTILDVRQLVRLPYQRRYLVPVSHLSFAQLSEIVQLKLYVQNRELQSVVADRIDDVMYRADYQKGPFRCYLTMAPVWKQQAIGLAGINRAHLSPERAEEQYLSILKTFPEVSVFVDIMIYQAAENPYQQNFTPYAAIGVLNIEQILPFSADARNLCDQTVRSLMKYVFDDKPGGK